MACPFRRCDNSGALNASLRAEPGAVPAVARLFCVAGQSPPFAVVERAGDLHLLGRAPGIHIPPGRLQLQFQRRGGQQLASVDLAQELGELGVRLGRVATQRGGDHP